MTNQNSVEFTPGTYVINKKHEDWGVGQIQSSIDEKLTINFEHIGKIVININKIELEIIRI